MSLQSSGQHVSRVGMIMPRDNVRNENGSYSLLLTVPGEADYLLENRSSQPLQELVYERVYVSGWLSGDTIPTLTVEQLEMLNDYGEDDWNEDEY